MLEMKNVTKTFDGFKALDDLILTVPKGAVYGLVGPNGAGKSTAIRHLTGVYRPDCGEITLEGTPIFENPAAKQRIGYIPDDIFYFPSASLEEMRRFYKGIYPNFDDDLFQKLYEVFQLPRKGQIRRFSKGMQKQAAFHLAICCKPDVLILDEPVDGLDPVMRRQVWSLLLSDVSQRETTVLVSSHNLRELEDVCDHVGIMDKGKLLATGDLESLRAMVSPKLKLRVKANHVPCDIEYRKCEGSVYDIEVNSEQEIPLIVKKIVDAGGDIYHVSEKQISLEEIYFSLLEKNHGRTEVKNDER